MNSNRQFLSIVGVAYLILGILTGVLGFIALGSVPWEFWFFIGLANLCTIASVIVGAIGEEKK